MLDVEVRCLRPLKAEHDFLQFNWIIFQFCGMDKAIELGETVQNLTK